MKYYMVEGMILDADRMNDAIMKDYMAYTQKAMDSGMIFLSGLKTDRSGGAFLMKAENPEEIESYLASEPFKLYGIQDYRWAEFDIHYINPQPEQWFQN